MLSCSGGLQNLIMQHVDHSAGVLIDLLHGLLKFEPSERMTAKEALKHSFFREPSRRLWRILWKRALEIRQARLVDMILPKAHTGVHVLVDFFQHKVPNGIQVLDLQWSRLHVSACSRKWKQSLSSGNWYRSAGLVLLFYHFFQVPTAESSLLELMQLYALLSVLWKLSAGSDQLSEMWVLVLYWIRISNDAKIWSPKLPLNVYIAVYGLHANLGNLNEEYLHSKEVLYVLGACLFTKQPGAPE